MAIDTIFDLFPSNTGTKFGRRQKRERGTRLPVTIVTGFLGSGKTTLVRNFLETPEGEGTALIVNEFGSVGIFVPPAPPGAPTGTIQLNDVFVDEREVVYTVDRHIGGLYCLEMDF